MPEINVEELSQLKKTARKRLETDLGADFLVALHDPKTVELLLNADGQWWQERLGEEMVPKGRFRPAQALMVLKTISGYHGKEIDRSNPLIECEFPLDNSRFAGQIPPVVSAPVFSLRKKAIMVFTFNQYVEMGIMTAEQCAKLKAAVRKHRNILVSGGTGSGKTTLINTLIGEMAETNPAERFVIIEDTAEIQCTAKNYIQYHTSAEVTMTHLLRTTLRMRPDRILVGETRGPEALDLLMAWNTGHEGGAATLHANNPFAALDRLLMLVSMHKDAPRDIELLISLAVHIVVQIERWPNGKGRRVTGMIEVLGFENGHYVTRDL